MLVNESRSSRRVSICLQIIPRQEQELDGNEIWAVLEGITLYFSDGKFTVHTADYFKKIWIDKFQG